MFHELREVWASKDCQRDTSHMKRSQGQACWCKPVILAILDAEAGRAQVQGQLESLSKVPPQNKKGNIAKQ